MAPAVKLVVDNTTATGHKRPRRGIRRRKDYGFIDDKHEIIYIMMRLVQLRMGETGKAFTTVIREAAVEAEITIGAPRGWFTGETRRPFFDTAFKFCNALGVNLLWHEVNLHDHVAVGKRGVRAQVKAASRG